MQIFQRNCQNPCFIETGSRITGLAMANFQYSKVFPAGFRNWYHFYVKSSNLSMHKFQDEMRQIFRKIKKLLSQRNNLIVKKITGEESLKERNTDIAKESHA